MSHIFISYSKKNGDYARKFAEKLLDSGFDVWIDDRIDYGEDWWAMIVQAIRDCAAFVVIMTPEADESRWVQREVTIADELGKPTFPLLLSGDIRTSKNWLIYVRTQFADVRDANLPPNDFISRLAAHAVRKPSRGQEASSSASAKRDTAEVKALISQVYQLLPAPFEWISIKGGNVTMQAHGGSSGRFSKSTSELTSVVSVSNFAISKYPVTNAQFAQFVNANGYAEHRWWNEDGWSVRTQNGWTKPSFWLDKKWNQPEQPVVGVSWYEAIAFCTWLSEMSGEVITLPSEKQWQRAAQGDDERQYPWGEDFLDNCCNFDSTSTMTVTSYEQTGVSPFGVVDMSGNVWEWCLTTNVSGTDSLDSLEGRVLKGGSWFGNLSYKLRANYRNWAEPTERDAVIGFRIVHA